MSATETPSGETSTAVGVRDRRQGVFPASPADLAAVRDRDRQAVRLAAEGLSYDQIAERLGYASRSGAWKAVRRALDRTEAGDVLTFRDIELARLERMHQALWPRALSGEIRAVHAVARLMDRRAALLGLDFADGPVEQHRRLREADVDFAAQLIGGVLADLGQDVGSPQVREAVRRRVEKLGADVVDEGPLE